MKRLHDRESGGSPARHVHCDGMTEPHIERSLEYGWRIVRRCRCGADAQPEAWSPSLGAVEAQVSGGAEPAAAVSVYRLNALTKGAP